MAKQPTVSNAQAFRKRKLEQDEGEIIELSSGLVVKVKRPSVPHMIKAGKLPASLAAAQFRIQTGAGRETSDKDIERLYQFQLKMVELALIEPKVTQKPDYDNNEISIEDVTEADSNEIFAWLNGGLEALDRFRGFGEGVSAGLGSETLPGDEA